jgi:hypothetical protein
MEKSVYLLWAQTEFLNNIEIHFMLQGVNTLFYVPAGRFNMAAASPRPVCK